MIHRAFVRCSMVCAFFGTLLLAGCGKSDAPSADIEKAGPSSTLNSQPATPALRLHWLGKNQLARDTNALNFMAIWNLPESLRLEAQVLDKLASAPWRLWLTNGSLSNAPIGSLRPLLADLLQQEVYLEARGDTNQPGELVLAIRLPSDRVAEWHTNLPTILRSALGVAPLPASAASNDVLLLQNEVLSCELSAAKDWYLVGLARPASTNQTAQAAAGNPAGPLASIRQRIAATGIPFVPGPTNYWLNLEAAVPQLIAAFGVNLPPSVKSLSLVTFSDGENVKIRGGLDLLKALPLPLDAWNVPTNQITQPLISFTAARGLRPLFESFGFWQDQQLGAAPNQIYFWSKESAPWLHFFTFKAPDSDVLFLALKDFILNRINPLLAPNNTGEFAWLTNESKVVWRGVPFCNPNFQKSGGFITGGFATDQPGREVIPVEMIQQLQSVPKLVYYDWEFTNPQVSGWTQLSQLVRMTFGYSQLSVTNAALPWLNAVGMHLGYSATTLVLEKENRLAFARSATIGLSSVELQILVDWLDSPNFPNGFSTFASPRDFRNNRKPPGL